MLQVTLLCLCSMFLILFNLEPGWNCSRMRLIFHQFYWKANLQLSFSAECLQEAWFFHLPSFPCPPWSLGLFHRTSIIKMWLYSFLAMYLCEFNPLSNQVSPKSGRICLHLSKGLPLRIQSWSDMFLPWILFVILLYLYFIYLDID